MTDHSQVWHRPSNKPTTSDSDLALIDPDPGLELVDPTIELTDPGWRQSKVQHVRATTNRRRRASNERVQWTAFLNGLTEPPYNLSGSHAAAVRDTWAYLEVALGPQLPLPKPKVLRSGPMRFSWSTTSFAAELLVRPGDENNLDWTFQDRRFNTSADSTKSVKPLRRFLQLIANVTDLGRIMEHVQAILEEEPLEDGMDHAAQPLVDAMLADASENRFRALKGIVQIARSDDFASSILRLIARANSRPPPWLRVDLVRSALRHGSTRVREAGMEAVEQWRDSELLQLLRLHDDSVEWLASYASDIIDDLGG